MHKNIIFSTLASIFTTFQFLRQRLRSRSLKQYFE